jgi:hypothetical protein
VILPPLPVVRAGSLRVPIDNGGRKNNRQHAAFEKLVDFVERDRM